MSITKSILAPKFMVAIGALILLTAQISLAFRSPADRQSHNTRVRNSHIDHDSHSADFDNSSNHGSNSRGSSRHGTKLRQNQLQQEKQRLQLYQQDEVDDDCDVDGNVDFLERLDDYLCKENHPLHGIQVSRSSATVTATAAIDDGNYLTKWTQPSMYHGTLVDSHSEAKCVASFLEDLIEELDYATYRLFGEDANDITMFNSLCTSLKKMKESDTSEETYADRERIAAAHTRFLVRKRREEEALEESLAAHEDNRRRSNDPLALHRTSSRSSDRILIPDITNA